MRIIHLNLGTMLHATDNGSIFGKLKNMYLNIDNYTLLGCKSESIYTLHINGPNIIFLFDITGCKDYNVYCFIRKIFI